MSAAKRQPFPKRPLTVREQLLPEILTPLIRVLL